MAFASSLLSLLTAFVVSAATALNGTYDLHEHLLGNHNAYIRPVAKPSDVTTVQVGMALLSLIHVDEQTGTVTLQIWQRMAWQDKSLTWKPEGFEGITSIQVPSYKIWVPDMVLYNSAVETSDESIRKTTQALVSHDGQVTWIPPVVIKALCRLDLTYFPHDSHSCDLKIGSWTYHGAQVGLALYNGQSEVDMSFFAGHSGWKVEGGPVKIQEKTYPCCDEPYSDISFNIKFTRRSTYFQYMYGCPVALIGLLTPFVFLIPAKNTHKITLGVGLLICLSMLLSSLGNVFPSTLETVPLLGRYCVCNYILLTLSLCLSCFILCASGGMLARTRRPPRCIKKLLIDHLSKLCCVPKGASLGVPEADNLVLATVEPLSPDHAGISVKPADNRRHPSAAIVEWIIVAHIMDRIFFILFTVTSVVLVIAFLAGGQ